ncbi:hypothetical protein H1R20_g15935, partial [Candolleomyces eurysporus]
MLGQYYEKSAPAKAARSESSRSTSTVPAYVVSTGKDLLPRAPSSALSARSESLPVRTLDDVRLQVAQETTIRAINKKEVIDGVQIGVISSTNSTSDPGSYIRLIAESLTSHPLLHSFLFIIADTTQSVPPKPTTLLVVGSAPDLVQRGSLLTSSKFVGRIISSATEDPKVWSALIQDLGVSTYDDTALWDVVRKAARQPIDPLLPPPGSRSIAQILSDARAKLQRITPMQAYRELTGENHGVLDAPTFLVDIRPQAQRAKHGGIRGSLVIERNVLEWRLDPRSDARLTVADRYDIRVIVFCQEGYTSSLAAYSLQKLGLLNATDVIGGFEAWRLVGLPVDTTQGTEAEERSLVSRAGSVV